MSGLNDLLAGMRKVEVDQIEKSLDDIWRETNVNTLSGGGVAVSRNAVMTLVIFTRNEAEAVRAMQSVESMSAVHPSRCILVTTLEAREGAPIEAYVGGRLRNVSGASSYGEQIVLEARDGAAQHLPGAVLPLILSGLPSFLWWNGEPPWRTEQFEAMVDGCDRIVLDTSEMTRGEDSLVALEDVEHRKISNCAFSDFNWTRQQPWRELVAGFFDSDSLRPYLEGIDRLTVEYAAGAESSAPNPAAAYLFVGWLASRLGWRTQSGARGTGMDEQRQHTLYSGIGQPITVEVTARHGVPIKSWHSIVAEDAAFDASASGIRPGAGQACVGSGALMTVHLHARVDGNTGTFAVARERDMRHASTLCHVPENALPSQTVHLPSLGESALLMEQLEELTHNTIYETALAAAAHLSGLTPGRVRP
ncbi:MAG TPA: glucose-6-phosphate dehydrogenase assembly protein OpcA [Ktedonobacterales bacterium]|nr:glucose-6-phosphate dehydrogenase assembly protein OpcA [Ktedonobacterales bacterium]